MEASTISATIKTSDEDKEAQYNWDDNEGVRSRSK